MVDKGYFLLDFFAYDLFEALVMFLGLDHDVEKASRWLRHLIVYPEIVADSFEGCLVYCKEGLRGACLQVGLLRVA